MLLLLVCKGGSGYLRLLLMLLLLYISSLLPLGFVLQVQLLLQLLFAAMGYGVWR